MHRPTMTVNGRRVPQPYASIASVLLIPAGFLTILFVTLVLLLALPAMIVMVIGDRAGH